MSRSPIEALFDTVDFTEVLPPDPVPDTLPYMVGRGVLKLGELNLQVAVLSNGQRILYGQGIESLVTSAHEILAKEGLA